MTSQTMHYSVPHFTQNTYTYQQGAGPHLGLPVRSHHNVQYDPCDKLMLSPCSSGDQSSGMLIKQLAQGITEAFCQEVRAPSLCFEEREEERAISLGAKSTKGPLNAALDVLMDSKFPLPPRKSLSLEVPRAAGVTCSHPREKSAFLGCRSS